VLRHTSSSEMRRRMLQALTSGTSPVGGGEEGSIKRRHDAIAVLPHASFRPASQILARDLISGTGGGHPAGAAGWLVDGTRSGHLGWAVPRAEIGHVIEAVQRTMVQWSSSTSQSMLYEVTKAGGSCWPGAVGWEGPHLANVGINHNAVDGLSASSRIGARADSGTAGIEAGNIPGGAGPGFLMPAMAVDLARGDHFWLSPAAGADSVVLRARWVPLQPWVLNLPFVGGLLRSACVRHAALVASLSAALVSDAVAARPVGLALHRLMVPPLLMRRLFRRWAAVLDLRDDQCDPAHVFVGWDWEQWLAASEAPVATEDGTSLIDAGGSGLGGASPSTIRDGGHTEAMTRPGSTGRVDGEASMQAQTLRQRTDRASAH